MAILPLYTLDGESSEFGKYAAEQLLTEMHSLKKFRIVDRALMEKVLSEMKLGMSGLLEAKTVKQVGQMLGADLVGTGTYTNLGEEVDLNARLIRTETGVVVGAANAKAKVDARVAKLLGSNARKGVPRAAWNKDSRIVENVDLAASRITVTDGKGWVKEFAVAPSTKIIKAGRAAQLADIAVSDRVTYQVGGMADNPFLESITVVAVKPVPAKGK